MGLKHTEGPWKACRDHEDFDGSIIYLDEEDTTEYNKRPYTHICSKGKYITCNHDLFTFENESNALLIATAPDLYESLKDLLVTCILRGDKLGLNDRGPVLDKARAAIKKAEGKV